MKSPLLYLLEVLFCSGLLMAFYRLLLMRKVSYALCRRYLVAAVLLSVLIPALDIPLYPARTVVYPLPLITAPEPLTVGPATVAEPVPVFPAAASEPSATAVVDRSRALRIAVAGLCLATTALLLGLFIAHLVSIARLRRRSRLTPCDGYTLAENPAVATPFSFLRTVFLGEGYDGRRRAIVLQHEASHVRHRHSAERIVVEAVRCLFWFNPFVWMAGRWLAEVQEWEADRDVLDAGYDLTEYRTVIFRQLFGYNPDIACGLNHSFTKNRFAMMTQFKKHRFACVRLGAAIPVVAGMMMLCSFTAKSPDTSRPSLTSEIHISADGGIYLNGERCSREDILGFVARERDKLSEADRAGMTIRLTADSLTGRPAPDLEGLEQVPVLEDLTIVELLQKDGGGCRFQEYRYLPADDSKYRRGPRHTITDLKGTDITEWARKHYMVVSPNPMFVVDGRLLTSQEYAEWNMLEYTEHGQGKTRSFEPCIYVGPEVGKRVGDPTVDVLVVYARSRAEEASSPAAGLVNLSCPLRSDKPVAPFGPRRHPVNNGVITHNGVDISAAKGTPVAAAADGKVLEAAYDGGYGNCIRIAHAGGYTSMYAHLASCDVKQGQTVKGGQRIGTVGDTGRATGPHLHFELARDGRRLDPRSVFDFAAGQPAGVSQRSLTDGSALLEGALSLVQGRVTWQARRHHVIDDSRSAMGGHVRFDFSEYAASPLKGMVVTCDSAIVGKDSRIKCFGSVVMENAAGDEFVSETLEISGNEWRMTPVKAETRAYVLPLPTLIIRKDGTFLLDGEPVTLAQIESKIKALYESLSEADRARMRVCLAPEPGVMMGVVTDVKQALRRVNALRISYRGTPDSRRSALDRVLPPVSGASGVVTVIPNNSGGKYPDREEIRIEERNVYLVLLNGSGQMMAGQPGRQQVMPLAELAAAVKRFVLNASDDPLMPEKHLQEFELPDGRKVNYPVSGGMVSIQSTRDTPYESYLEMQNRLTQAFADIRDDVSQQWFGKSFAALGDAQQEVVMRAVPLKISEAEPRTLTR